MMPMSPSPDVVERRLAIQRDLLAEIRKLQPLSVDQLLSDPIRRAALERMMQAVVDLALDINGHVVSSVLRKSPGTGRESFDLMVTAGVLDAEHAALLKPAVGLRNILVHMYADIDVTIIAESADEFEEHFSAYVRSVARWMLQSSDSE